MASRLPGAEGWSIEILELKFGQEVNRLLPLLGGSWCLFNHRTVLTHVKLVSIGCEGNNVAAVKLKCGHPAGDGGLGGTLPLLKSGKIKELLQ